MPLSAAPASPPVCIVFVAALLMPETTLPIAALFCAFPASVPDLEIALVREPTAPPLSERDFIS